jgi:MoaA/NifB/PqqE/SkfB family radical SAM enzyme
MKEWNKKNWMNSFNSAKGLLYSEHYKAISKWKKSKNPKDLLPPIEVSLDPIHKCNLNCEHCNASRYLTANLTEDKVRMSDEHLINLVEFLGKWGVKAICFGGGGEPTLHTKLPEAILLARKLGMETSVATNGTILNEHLIKAYLECRWIGISVDSATKEVYNIGRKANEFDKVIHNLGLLSYHIKRTNSKCDLAYKFLIFDYNQHEIYKACKLAKKLGVKDFHARPADFSHQGMEQKKSINPYNISKIKQQFNKCHQIENNNFRVFTVVHKFNNDFTPKRNFTQCYAAPICIQLCADGNIYLCPDQRQVNSYKFGEHYPNPENIIKAWGNDLHYKLCFKSGCSVCTSRCTFSPYNEMCQKLFIEKEDPFCKNFV